MKHTISAALGAQKAIELDLVTGMVIVLDSERGVTLAPAEALRALRFLAQYEELIGLSSFLATIADEGQKELEVL